MVVVTEYERFLRLVKKRRTIRQFLPDPVPDQYISDIIEAARWAPSAFHTQPWEFVVINDEKLKNQIVSILERHAPPIKDPTKASLRRKSFKDAPVFILLLCDWRARFGLPGQPRSIEQATSLFTSSLANTFLYMHLAATALGLSSQWYTATSRPGAEVAIKEIVGIPEALTIFDMMVVGYAANKPGPKIIRDTAEMVHYNDCGPQDFRTDEEVAAYAEKTKAWCLSEH